MKVIFGLLIALILSGCATRQPVDFSAFRAASPRSILVVPVVNQSLEVDAANYMLTTMSVPLAEKGYYVFPVNTVKFVLEQEGFYEPERIQQQRPADLAQFFDADAVLFVTISRWDAQYVVITTTVTVAVSYVMYDRQGNVIWKADKQMQYTPQAQSGGHPIATLIAAAIQAAVTKAAPNYMPLARQANQLVFVVEPTALPDGPYVTGAVQANAQPGQRSAGTIALAPAAPTQETPVATAAGTAPKARALDAPVEAARGSQPPAPPAAVTQPTKAEAPAAPAATPMVMTAQAAPAARRSGQSSFEIEKMGREKNCDANARAWLVSQEPGVELYTYQCNASDTWNMRCEFRQCRRVN